MKYSYIALFLVFSCGSVFSNQELSFQVCDIEDSYCVNEQTKTAIVQLADGIPELNIKPTDPIEIPAVEGEEFDGVKLHFTNVKFTGLKAAKDVSFSLDKVTKSGALNLTIDAKIVADIAVRLPERKAFTGTYTSQATVIVETTYNYELIKDVQGDDHFEMGPETTNCDVSTDPKVTLNPELEEALNKDPDAKSKKDKFEAKKVAQRKKTFCKIVNKAIQLAFESYRQLDKAFPAKTFIKNL